jgi:hypothetical protein
MGFLDDVGDFIGSTAKWTVSAGGKVLTAAVDLENWTVSLADEVWTAIPGELWTPTVGPLAGVLKRKFNDELFMLAGPRGLIAGLGVFPAELDDAARIIIAGAALIGAIKQRKMNDEEWRMANWAFGGQLPPRENIRLTNFGVPKRSGFFDRPITFPAIANQYYINMGAAYRHKSTIKDGALLLHELTHVWQGRNKLIRDVQILVAAKDRDYDYHHGSQWRDYGLEQQAQIVQDWANGQIDNTAAKPAGPLSLGSPLFRYIYTNVRRNDNRARSVAGTSIRRLAAPNEPTKTLRLSDIHPPAPHRWWPDP